MMFPTVLPLPSTRTSFATGPECFLAHAGSASIATGLRVGGFPAKVIVPVMDEAARAIPGQTDTATSIDASRNPFAVPRMLGSLFLVCRLWQDLVLCRLGSSLGPCPSEVRRLYTEPRVCATPHTTSRQQRPPRVQTRAADPFEAVVLSPCS